MSKHLNVYISLDSLFDYRQGLITKLVTDPKDDIATRLVKGLEIWQKEFESNYQKRTMDEYEKPELGLTTAKFKEAYANRDINDFAFYVPSRLTKALMSSVMAVELDYDQVPDITAFTLTINTFPYEMPDDLKEVLKDSLNQRFGGRHPITLIHKDDRLATPSFYRSFTHVFKYDMLLGDYKAFFSHLDREPIPDVVFFVPSLFLKREEYITGNPSDVIEAVFYTLVNQIAVIPVPVSAYDYD